MSAAPVERGFPAHQKSKTIRKKKGKAQAHQNKFKFRHNKRSKTTQFIAGISRAGLCARCVQIIQWRKDYRKYKVLKQPKKCTKCSERKILRAYHILCRDCASELGVCAKCKKPGSVEEEQPAELSYEEVHQKLSSFREADKRAIIREIERGALDANDIEKLQKEARTGPSKPSKEEEALPTGPLIPPHEAAASSSSSEAAASSSLAEAAVDASEDTPMEE